MAQGLLKGVCCALQLPSRTASLAHAELFSPKGPPRGVLPQACRSGSRWGQVWSLRAGWLSLHNGPAPSAGLVHFLQASENSSKPLPQLTLAGTGGMFPGQGRWWWRKTTSRNQNWALKPLVMEPVGRASGRHSELHLGAGGQASRTWGWGWQRPQHPTVQEGQCFLIGLQKRFPLGSRVWRSIRNRLADCQLPLSELPT